MPPEDLSVPISFGPPSPAAPPTQNKATLDVPIQWNRPSTLSRSPKEKESGSIPISANVLSRSRVMSPARLEVNPNIMQVEVKPEQIAATITDIDRRFSDYIRLARIRIRSMSEQ
ncbi:hypothetical protein MLD38_031801 [Melastoma candidum]|nr:hypothetical protein MLD38_031801 [Melastoma candidum]